jgi:hypothetical protein
LELPGRTGRWLIAAGLLLAFLILLVLARSLRHDRVEGHAFDIPPADHPIIVEVLNGSGRDGLARLGARRLRRRGFDVVFFGNGPAVDSTEVLARRGGDDNASRVARALGVGRVVTRRDSLLRVDVTVLLGPDFTPDEAGRP